MTGEISFSVWQTESGLGYKCWRLTCGESGFIPLVSTPQGDYVKKKEFRIFEFETAELNSWKIMKFWQKYELTSEELSSNRVVQCPSRGSFIFPVFNYSGFEIGKLERWYSWHQEPPAGLGRKALYYTESEAPRVHFPPGSWFNANYELGSSAGYNLKGPKDPGPLYIVEDCLSAIKVARKELCCALLGTSLSDEVLDELLRVPCSRFVFILDPDAFGKAMEIKARIGMLKEVEVKYLEKDPKDTPYEELVRVL